MPEDPMGAKDKCTARAKTTGARCGRYPHPGATVCTSHGGKAPQVRAKAAVRVLAAQVEQTVEKRRRLFDGAVTVEDPLRALQELAGKLRVAVDVLNERIDVERLRYSSDIGTEQIRGEVQLLIQAAGLLGGLLTSLGRLKIDERLVRIEEQTAQMVLRALEAGLASAGVTGAAATQARTEAARHLRVIEGGKA